MTDFNEITMTSLNTNNITAAGQSADNSSGDTADNFPGTAAAAPKMTIYGGFGQFRFRPKMHFLV